jgi:predicted ribosomally synthesized peptide with SipW-like signal peptide
MYNGLESQDTGKNWLPKKGAIMFSKKATIAIIALAMVVVGSSGLTHAHFTDTGVSPNNSFTAWTLDL